MTVELEDIFKIPHLVYIMINFFARTFFVSLKTNNIVNIQLVETCSVVAMKIRLQQTPEPRMTCWGPGPQHYPYLRLLYSAK